MSATLSATDAARQLGVALTTLYAYVSRGLIRTGRDKRDTRQRRYDAGDVRRLAERNAARRDPDNALASALSWGLPVLPTKITLIEHGRLYYRGHDAMVLARTQRFESVCALLWRGALDAQAQWPDARTTAQPPRAVSAIDRIAQALARDTAQIGADAVRAVRSMQAASCPHGRLRGPVGAALARAYAPAHAGATAFFDALLIACADHEFNVSAFSARCVASAGAPLGAALTAGVGALRGAHHGGVTARVADVLRGVRDRSDIGRALGQLRGRGGRWLGFGHPLYPDGDPRTRLLLELLPAALGRTRRWQLLHDVITRAQDAAGAAPTVDIALGTAEVLLDAEPGSALGWFALGRSAGWIAHCHEQTAMNMLIRPRARYVGVRPVRA
jgi:citrate synthase